MPPFNNHSLVRLKRPFLGADLRRVMQGAQGESKACSGTGATRSEASMARTDPLTRPSTLQPLPRGSARVEEVTSRAAGSVASRDQEGRRFPACVQIPHNA